MDMFDILSQASSNDEQDKKVRAAVDKLRAEMEKNQQMEYIQYVGDYLIDYLGMHPDMSEKILCKGKTIKGSVDAMKSTAKKVQSNGCGMISDQKGFEIVVKYFSKTEEKAAIKKGNDPAEVGTIEDESGDESEE